MLRMVRVFRVVDDEREKWREEGKNGSSYRNHHDHRLYSHHVLAVISLRSESHRQNFPIYTGISSRLSSLSFFLSFSLSLSHTHTKHTAL